MGKGARLKKTRQQQSTAPGLVVTEEHQVLLSDMRDAYEIRGLKTTDREIALWLATTIWRNQTNMSCLEACHTLSAALDSMGIAHRRVAVGVYIADPERGANVLCGQVAVDWMNKGVGREVAQPFTARAQEAGWKRGGHMVVVCDELDLFLDSTFDQFGVKGVDRILLPLSDGAGVADGALWSARFERPGVEGETHLAYFEVDDTPVSVNDEEFAAFARISARDLMSVGIATGFDTAVYDVTSGPTYITSEVLGQLDGVPPSQVSEEVDAFYARRDARLAGIGYPKGAPRVWAVG